MGLFDDIRCECALPLPQNQSELAGRNWREQIFQTKDLHCLMFAYLIRNDGTLWEQTYEWETNRKGLPRCKSAGWLAMSSYTGTVCFYNSIYGNKTDYWVEWAAIFVSGKLSELKLHRWEERDNGERLASEAEWKFRNEERERFLARWVGRRIYPVYAWVVHGFFGLSLYRFGQRISSLCSRLGLAFNRIGDKLAPYGDPIREEWRERALCDLIDEDGSG